MWRRGWRCSLFSECKCSALPTHTHKQITSPPQCHDSGAALGRTTNRRGGSRKRTFLGQVLAKLNTNDSPYINTTQHSTLPPHRLDILEIDPAFLSSNPCPVRITPRKASPQFYTTSGFSERTRYILFQKSNLNQCSRIWMGSLNSKFYITESRFHHDTFLNPNDNFIVPLCFY